MAHTFLRDLPWKKCKKEKYRLATFKNYPENFKIFPSHLASEGFVYLDNGSVHNLKCCFCRKVFSADERIHDHHRSTSPHCPMVTKADCENIPFNFNKHVDLRIRETLEDTAQIVKTYQHGTAPLSSSDTGNKKSTEVVPCGSHLKITVWNPCNPDFTQMSQRLSSFFSPSEMLKRRSKEFADAGFIYAQLEDNMICFYCNKSIRHWRETANPYVEHAKLAPNCDYVNIRMSDSFVQDVQQITRHHPSEVQSNTASPVKDALRKFSASLPVETCHPAVSNMCRICNKRQKSVLCLPCHHWVICIDCAGTRTCPECRKPVTQIARACIN
ncbi:baculoviral IAP repeat-containing protein 7-B-like [Physella acuta]|uniref:baculoviral IAP repeat-containing protein 7-B-like n=1 Tax=Physella acuta TaxID=109671 RepID=UPI0027DB47F0|nr:baculoviral IAP repeat-containing protein 7-B-like [Physella acuta]